MTKELMALRQLPIIEQHLQAAKEEIEAMTAEKQRLVCTPDTYKDVKKARAELNKRFSEMEERRKQIKAQIMAPYAEFEAVYNDCVAAPFKRCDEALKVKIRDVEDGIKADCEAGLREYFQELCTAHGVDWLTFEMSGVRVDMVSAQQKTPKKLRESLLAFVVGVERDLETISGLDFAEEILIEYKQTLDLPSSFSAVQNRHKRIEEERTALKDREVFKEREEQAVEKVQALAPPEPKMTVTFTVTDTRERLIALREWMKTNNYDYGGTQ